MYSPPFFPNNYPPFFPNNYPPFFPIYMLRS